MPVSADIQGMSNLAPTKVEYIDSSVGDAPTPEVEESSAVDSPPAAPPQVNETTESRKLYLQAQKAERRAQELLKGAKTSSAKADAIERALADKDPTAILRAAGLDPKKYYQDLTRHALSDPSTPVDPVTEKLAAHEAKLLAYEQAIQKQQADLTAREEQQAESNVIGQAVMPIISNNLDKYETIVAYSGDNAVNAAVYVYNTVKQIYAETGEIKDFTEVADQLEKYHEEQTDIGIKKALSMKKFSSKYGSQLAPTSENNDEPLDQNDKPRSATLTKQPVPKQSNNSESTYSNDPAERRKMVLKKLGIK